VTIPAGTPVDALLSNPPLSVFSTLLAAQTATASIANPDMFVAGVAYKATDHLTVLVDYQWTHWSTFNVLNLTFSPTTLLNQTH
jgi:long-subunit fatty acid transport protein